MRRQFLEVVTGASVLAEASWFAKGAESTGEIPRRRLGHTGEMVSMVGLGGYHRVRPNLDEAESIRIVRAAIDQGVNFLDNCWDYNGGQSELRMGKALRDGYRQRAFLMTKIDGRDKKTAMQQIEESLRRLETDHINLLQFHEVIRMDDPDHIFAAGGSMEAVLEARKAGKIRYIGFTGHKSPAIHLKMLATADSHQFRFDTVQMPLNVMDAHYDSFEKNVFTGAGEERYRRAWDEADGRPHNPGEQDRLPGRMPTLRHEPSDQRGDHRLPLDANPRSGGERRTEFPAHEARPSRGPSGEDRAGRASRQV
jgi:hypothetical protein